MSFSGSRILVTLITLQVIGFFTLRAHVALAVDSKPNIVIILVDDMGYGDPGCYNAESKIPTPNIDSLAAGGMRFTDAHASGPLCHMSRYGLMTGEYPFRVNTGLWRKQPLIRDGQMTIATMLRDHGYRTAMVGKWHLGFAENGYDKPLPGGPIHRGFESYFGIRASTDIPPYFYIRGDKAVSPPTDTIEANASEGWSANSRCVLASGGNLVRLKTRRGVAQLYERGSRSHRCAPSTSGRQTAHALLGLPRTTYPVVTLQEVLGKKQSQHVR